MLLSTPGFHEQAIILVNLTTVDVTTLAMVILVILSVAVIKATICPQTEGLAKVCFRLCCR